MSNSVPTGWSLTTLGQVSDFVMGQAPLGSTCNKVSIGVPFVKAGEFASKYPVIREWTTSPLKFAKRGDVLMCVVGATCGKLNLGIDCAIGRSVAAIRPSAELDSAYLYNFLTPLVEMLRHGSAGSAQGVITKDNLDNIEMVIPVLPEQQKIATILTAVDEVIASTQAQISKLKVLKTAMMQELLTKGIGHTEFKDSAVGRIPATWEVKPLGHLAKLERGRFSQRPRNDPAFYGGHIPFLQTGDIPKNSPYISEFTQTLNEKGLSVSKLFEKGTLVITIAATIGEIGLLKFDSCFPDSLVGITVNQSIADSTFILYSMRSRKDDLESLAPQTAQKNINLEILNPFLLAAPPLKEQQLIGKSMEAIDTKIEAATQKYDRSVSVKKALMQDLLTGKVRVRVN